MTVGCELGVTADTVNEYLKRIRQKYADAGRPTRTKVDLINVPSRTAGCRYPNADPTGSLDPPTATVDRRTPAGRVAGAADDAGRVSPRS